MNRLALHPRVSFGRSVSIRGRVWVHGEGTVRVEDDVVLDARAAPIELHAYRGAEINIARGVRIDSGSSLEAMARITVGPYAKLGPFSKLMDNNFHPLDDQNRMPPSRPVFVGERAEVGPRAILLPGAWIASDARVPAGAVVSRRFGTAQDAADGLPAEPQSAAVRGPEVRVPSGLFAKLRAGAELIRSVWYLRGCERGTRVHVGGRVLVANEGRVRFGDHSVLLGGMIPTAIRCDPGASIDVGAGTIFNYGVSLDASGSIRIGSRCRFGSHVRVSDGRGGRVQPVVIGDDVWIAHGATIEPGVTIGSGSVVSAGSTVTSDVPSGSLAIGNPARCMSITLRSAKKPAVRTAAAPGTA